MEEYKRSPTLKSTQSTPTKQSAKGGARETATSEPKQLRALTPRKPATKHLVRPIIQDDDDDDEEQHEDVGDESPSKKPTSKQPPKRIPQSQDREVLPQVGRSPVPVFSSSETESEDDEDVPLAAALPHYEAYSDDEQDYDGPSSPHLLRDDQDETDPISKKKHKDSKEESEEDPEERQLYITQSKFLQYPKYDDDRDLHVAVTSRPKEPQLRLRRHKNSHTFLLEEQVEALQRAMELAVDVLVAQSGKPPQEDAPVDVEGHLLLYPLLLKESCHSTFTSSKTNYYHHSIRAE